jgi:hypothetical protein
MHWTRRLFHKPRAERELDQELRFHLEQQILDNLAAGMSSEEARRAPMLWEAFVQSALLVFRGQPQNLKSVGDCELCGTKRLLSFVHKDEQLQSAMHISGRT